MLPLPSLRDLFAHLEWAESLVWTTALSSPAAVGDPELLDRLRHLHATQRAFLDVWTGRDVGRYQDQEFASLRELYAWVRPYYSAVTTFLTDLRPDGLDAPMPVPWAAFFARRMGTEPVITTLGETLFQVIAHSTYHRAQVNTRLRALDIKPPTVDFIVWVWVARPAAEWPAVTAGA